MTGAGIRKNISIHDRRTTIVLEQLVWDGLLDICRWESLSLDALCETVVGRRGAASMSSMLRTTLLEYYREMADAHAAGAPNQADAILMRAMTKLDAWG